MIAVLLRTNPTMYKTSKCYCGSGKKYSKCCYVKDYKEGTAFREPQVLRLAGEGSRSRTRFIKTMRTGKK